MATKPNDAFRWICPKCSTVNGIQDAVCLGGSCRTLRPMAAPDDLSELRKSALAIVFDPASGLPMPSPENTAAVDALIREVMELRAAVKEWLCESCNTVYPGPPQPGFKCVQCPKCQGMTGPRQTIELRRLRIANERRNLDRESVVSETTDTLAITRIREGEEVVTAGEDGKTWIATFASAEMARDYVEEQQSMGSSRIDGLRIRIVARIDPAHGFSLTPGQADFIQGIVKGAQLSGMDKETFLQAIGICWDARRQ